MKKKALLVMTALVLPVLLSSCGNVSSSGSSNENSAPKEIVFTQKDLVQSSYGGLGVEWGVYEDTDKLDASSWERIYANMIKLAPARIRLMINYDYFVENFDDKGDDDKTNDTWDYNFSNQWGNNLAVLLSYCQSHNIQVALGAWNVVGTLSNDVWNMMDECTSDIRWSKISAFVMDYLVNKQGFTCIRWFVNGNEPNYLGVKGSSKNYNNSFEKWMQGVKNVRAALDAKGLTNIGIVGGDTTGFDGTKEYWKGIATNIPSMVSDYGAHFYLSNYYIDGGYALEYMNDLNKEVHPIDSGYGTTRPLDIWESGLLDGKDNATDGNSLIKTVSYGVRMADFTLQSALAGINSVCYWDFDDGMNFMYTSGTAVPKKWGMFSSLASDQAYDQELRPWYHSSCLLTHLMAPGSRIYGSSINDRNLDPTFRCLAVTNQAMTRGGYVMVNRGTQAITKRVTLEPAIANADKLYIYTFGEGAIRLGEDGFIIPNQVIDGSLNRWLNVTIPANMLYVVSTEAL